MSETVHATAVLVGADGVLIRGPSGSGKSSLAFRLIERGARLVGDDRVHLSACHGRILATGHAAVGGRLELRGRGLIAVPQERSALVRLIVDIVDEGGLERLPEHTQLECVLLGVTLPRQPVSTIPDRAQALVSAALQALSQRSNMGLRSA